MAVAGIHHAYHFKLDPGQKTRTSATLYGHNISITKYIYILMHTKILLELRNPNWQVDWSNDQDCKSFNNVKKEW